MRFLEETHVLGLLLVDIGVVVEEACYEFSHSSEEFLGRRGSVEILVVANVRELVGVGHASDKAAESVNGFLDVEMKGGDSLDEAFNSEELFVRLGVRTNFVHGKTFVASCAITLIRHLLHMGSQIALFECSDNRKRRLLGLLLGAGLGVVVGASHLGVVSELVSGTGNSFRCFGIGQLGQAIRRERDLRTLGSTKIKRGSVSMDGRSDVEGIGRLDWRFALERIFGRFVRRRTGCYRIGRCVRRFREGGC